MNNEQLVPTYSGMDLVNMGVFEKVCKGREMGGGIAHFRAPMSKQRARAKYSLSSGIS